MTMASSGSRRRTGRRWVLGPVALCVVATLLFAAPLRVFGLKAPEPVFPLAAAFVWAALRPSMIAPAALVMLGLFLDLVWGGPIGLWPLCLLTAHMLALSVRRLLSGEDFAVLWVWYAASCLAAFGLGEVLLRLGCGVWPNLVGLALQAGVTIALFPLAWWLIERYHTDEARLK
jgi:rod shape-determining protein MreD